MATKKTTICDVCGKDMDTLHGFCYDSGEFLTLGKHFLGMKLYWTTDNASSGDIIDVCPDCGTRINKAINGVLHENSPY